MSTRDKTNASRSKAQTNKSNNRKQTPSTSNGAERLASVNNREQIGRKRTSQRGTNNLSRNISKKSSQMENVCENIEEDLNSSEMTIATGSCSIEQHLNDSACKQEEQETDVDNTGIQTIENDESTSLLAEKSGSVTPSSSKENANSNNDVDLTNEILPQGWEQHTDQIGPYFWHISSGIIQRDRPVSEPFLEKDSIVIYHDDEEINQVQKTSSDDDEFYESGAALTIDDTSESTFVVYPLGCCEFDETQLVSATSTKAIQKCILRLSNTPSGEENVFWGLDQSQPVLMKLFGDHIQFIDLESQTLLRSQPIQTIRAWAVDDDNDFAFVVEDRCSSQMSPEKDISEQVDYALLSEPMMMCFVFRSLDDDDMSCKVAAKLNEEINRYREQMSDRVVKSTRMQQMVEQKPNGDITDAEEFEELEASNEITLNVKYIGKTIVPRPTGIDVLNIAIDKCLADASKAQINCSTLLENDGDNFQRNSTLTEAKLHVSPSSVIVENEFTGEIIVECRIRYLTFMGISRRDIRWCGFIMQNPTNKTFSAHCFECYPTAGHVCEAIEHSCTKMYEKVVKTSRQPETVSIIPTGSKIRDTLAKTFSRIKLNPIR